MLTGTALSFDGSGVKIDNGCPSSKSVILLDGLNNGDVYGFDVSSNCACGIELTKSSENTLHDMTVATRIGGICFYDNLSEKNTIKNLSVDTHELAVVVTERPSGNTFLDTVIFDSHAMDPASFSFAVFDGNDTVLDNVTMSKDAHFGSTGDVTTNFTLKNSHTAGITIWYVYQSLFADNVISGSHCGIEYDFTTSQAANVIKNNDVSGSMVPYCGPFIGDGNTYINNTPQPQ